MPLQKTNTKTIFWCSTAPWVVKENEALGGNVSLRQYKVMQKHYDAADFIVYQTEYSRQLAKKIYSDNGVTKEGRVILPGIFHSYTQEKIRPPELRLVASAQDWTEQKRLMDTVKAVDLFRGERKDVTLSIFGRIGNRKHRGIIEKKKWISHYGAVGHPRIWEMYAEHDFMVFLSYRDAGPLTVAEALGCGLPVVTVDNGGGVDIAGHAAMVAASDGNVWHQKDGDVPRLKMDKVVPKIQNMENAIDIMRNRAVLRVRQLSMMEEIGPRWEKVIKEVADA